MLVLANVGHPVLAPTRPTAVDRGPRLEHRWRQSQHEAPPNARLSRYRGESRREA